MKRVRTFIDASLLIAAARGTQEISEQALAIFDDPRRASMTSDFVRLEVMPKAVFHHKHAEAHFYSAFFAAAERVVRSSAALVAMAEIEAEVAGLSAVDALHVAAAKMAKCQEMITTEKAGQTTFSSPRSNDDHDTHTAWPIA